MIVGTPIVMTVGESIGVFAIALIFSVSVMSIAFFGLRYWHKRKHPTEDDIKETNRKRREREKLKRKTTEKVNAYMSGKSSNKDEEHIPNGKRCGKYKKKGRRK